MKKSIIFLIFCFENLALFSQIGDDKQSKEVVNNFFSQIENYVSSIDEYNNDTSTSINDLVQSLKLNLEQNAVIDIENIKSSNITYKYETLKDLIVDLKSFTITTFMFKITNEDKIVIYRSILNNKKYFFYKVLLTIGNNSQFYFVIVDIESEKIFKVEKWTEFININEWKPIHNIEPKVTFIDTDLDGLTDDKDKCPYQKGLIVLSGCPSDKDSDGILDDEDLCPNDAGNKNNNGCPDSDEDGIIDLKDNCKYVKGIARYNGCPNVKIDNGAGNLFYSFLLPGIATKKVYGHYKSKAFFRSFFYILSAGGSIFSHYYSKEQYNLYLNSTNIYQINDYYNKANNFNKAQYVFLGTAITIVTTEIIDIVIKGIKNKKISQKNGYKCFSY
jgi:hypothetical protein